MRVKIFKYLIIAKSSVSNKNLFCSDKNKVQSPILAHDVYLESSCI